MVLRSDLCDGRKVVSGATLRNAGGGIRCGLEGRGSHTTDAAAVRVCERYWKAPELASAVEHCF